MPCGEGHLCRAFTLGAVTTSRALRVLLALPAAVLVAGCSIGGGTGGSTGDSTGGATTDPGSSGSSATTSGSTTNCDLTGCTISFPRSGTGTVTVLGVSATLVGVDEGSARIQVAGQTITVPVGGTTEVEGFTVGVERVTDAEVVVRVSP